MGCLSVHEYAVMALPNPWHVNLQMSFYCLRNDVELFLEVVIFHQSTFCKIRIFFYFLKVFAFQ